MKFIGLPLKEIKNLLERASFDLRTALRQQREVIEEAFTGGNQAISDSLKKLYADEQNWPATFQKPYSDEVGNFICQVAALNKN